jgi:tripartite-type tricarboxylate transporter receptor subunit TctC
MKKTIPLIFFTLLAMVLLPATSIAAPSFYEGKTIRIIVGYPAGGGYDAYCRMLARHMGRHIPGNPTLLVDNMVGAGSLVAANYLFKAAKPDGLTIGHVNGGHFLSQLFGQPGIEFDARKFEYLGAPIRGGCALAVTKASGVTNLNQLLSAKTPLKLGGTMTGVIAPDNVTRVLKAALNLPIQLVSGYKGTPEIRLAAEGGELAGCCWEWDAIKATWTKAVSSGDVNIILQAVPTPFADLPKVPLAVSLAKTPEAKQLIEVGAHLTSVLGRPFLVPPGVPKDRVQILRKAFQDTMQDKEFMAEAAKSNLSLDPVGGDELARIVDGFFKLDMGMQTKLKEILYGK